VRAPRDEAELDDRIIQRSLAHGPAAAAAYCHEVLDSGSWPADVSRAMLLVHVGEYSAMAGDQAAAETAFREAVADAGRARPDARCYLAGWCLEHGTLDEGQRLIDDIWRERPTDPDVYLYLGELHEERDDLAGATR
jgi:predicted Zn-dependent protease